MNQYKEALLQMPHELQAAIEPFSVLLLLRRERWSLERPTLKEYVIALICQTLSTSTVHSRDALHNAIVYLLVPLEHPFPPLSDIGEDNRCPRKHSPDHLLIHI